MALLSGSTRRPTVAIGPPSAGIHAHVVSLTKPSVQTVRAAPNASAIAPIDTRPARGPTRRSGATTARRTKATKGSPRTSSGSQTLGAIALATEQVEAVRLDGPANAEDRDDDRQPDRDLGDRDGDGEEREDEPRHVPVEARERDEVDVDGVEHQLDPEQDADCVATGQDTEEADREHERPQDQVRRTTDHSSLPAKQRAPRGPTTRTT